MLKLNKSNILRTFNHVYSHGKSFANRHLVLYVTHDYTPNGKVGFAAGKKLGNAVTRNRAKRLMREAFRLYQNSISRNCTIIIVARKGIVDAKLVTVTSALIDLCRRAKIWHD